MAIDKDLFELNISSFNGNLEHDLGEIFTEFDYKSFGKNELTDFNTDDELETYNLLFELIKKKYNITSNEILEYFKSYTLEDSRMYMYNKEILDILKKMLYFKDFKGGMFDSLGNLSVGVQAKEYLGLE